MLKRIKRKIAYLLFSKISEKQKTRSYVNNGRIPWSEGYENYKWKEIEKAINNRNTINNFLTSHEFTNYGLGLDERIVEYPWVISNISDIQCRLLDAGSTFNFKVILDNAVVNKKEIIILTYYPEHQNFNEKRISYLYSDLRNIPIRDNYFNEIVCISTLEHIDMNNSMYGYEIEFETNFYNKSYDYLLVVKEFLRVLKKSGKLLITVPYGHFENHGFFQQFDSEMIYRLKKLLEPYGLFNDSYYMYNINGWKSSNKDECKESHSFNPHTGVGKGTDNAAHSRAICCIMFIKN